MPTGKLGPHSNIELELMLRGEKKVSYFFGDVPPKFILTMRQYPQIEYHQSENEYMHIFYLTGYQAQAQALEALLKQSLELKGYTDESIERGIGRLLGYSEADIDLYIAKRIEAKRMIWDK